MTRERRIGQFGIYAFFFQVIAHTLSAQKTKLGFGWPQCAATRLPDVGLWEDVGSMLTVVRAELIAHVFFIFKETEEETQFQR